MSARLSVRPAHIVFTGLIVLAFYGFSQHRWFVSVEIPAIPSLLAVARIFCSVCLILFIPGSAVLPLFLRRSPSFLMYLFQSFILNAPILIALSISIKLLGYETTWQSFFFPVLVLFLIFGGILFLRRPVFTLEISLTGTSLHMAVIAALVSGVWHYGNFSFQESDFMDVSSYFYLKEAERNVNATGPLGLSPEYQGPWMKLDEHALELPPAGGEILYNLPGGLPREATVTFLIKGGNDSVLTLSANGQAIFRTYMQPPLESEDLIRNYPPAIKIVSEKVILVPGENRIRFSMTDMPYRVPGRAELLVYNFSHLEGHEMRTLVRRLFYVTDIGDSNEQLELARSLKKYLYHHVNSFAGGFYDGGGYTITHLPLASFYSLFSLVLLGDELSSIRYLFLGTLCLLYLVQFHLLRRGGKSPSWMAATISLLGILIYVLLIFPMHEEISIRTIYVILLLLSIHFLNQKIYPAVAVSMLLLLLTKLGWISLPCIVIAYLFVHRKSTINFLRKSIYAVLLFFAILLILGVVLKAAGLWEMWGQILLTDSYFKKYSILMSLFGIDREFVFNLFGNSPYRALFQGILIYSLLISAASFGLAFLGFFRNNREGLIYSLTGLFLFFLLAISDPTISYQPYAFVHRLSRSVGVYNLFLIGGGIFLISQLSSRTWITKVLTLAVLAVIGYWGTTVHSSHVFAVFSDYGPAHAHDRRKAIVNVLMRRLNREIGAQGDFREIKILSKKGLLVDPEHGPFWYALGKCSMNNGEYEKALEQFTKATESMPEFYSLYFDLANTLTRLGRLQEADDMRKRAMTIE